MKIRRLHTCYTLAHLLHTCLNTCLHTCLHTYQGGFRP